MGLRVNCGFMLSLRWHREGSIHSILDSSWETN
jgi:hypothetical protein